MKVILVLFFFFSASLAFPRFRICPMETQEKSKYSTTSEESFVVEESKTTDEPDISYELIEASKEQTEHLVTKIPINVSHINNFPVIACPAGQFRDKNGVCRIKFNG